MFPLAVDSRTPLREHIHNLPINADIRTRSCHWGTAAENTHDPVAEFGVAHRVHRCGLVRAEDCVRGLNEGREYRS